MLIHAFSKSRPPPRVVVIGASGFVGNAVLRRLEAGGVPVVGLDRSKVDLSRSDAADKLANVFQPGDAVVASAARAPCKDLDMLVENMQMVRMMVTAIGRVPVGHVVNISSDAVYGDDELPLTERSTAAPGSLHGVMHRAREIAFRDQVKAPLAILRLTLTYGLRDPHNGYGPNRFRRSAAAGEPIVLFGEGEELRDHVYIDDVAEIVARTVLLRSAGTLNIASGNVYSFRQIAEWTVRMNPNSVPIVTTPRTGPMPHNGFRPFDIRSLRAAFPDCVPIDLPDGMKRANGTN